MRLEIDTSRDSHEEIRKAIKLLLSLVGDSNVLSNEPQNIFDNANPSVPTGGSVFGNLFDDVPAGKQETTEQKEAQEKPEIEFY